MTSQSASPLYDAIHAAIDAAGVTPQQTRYTCKDGDFYSFTAYVPAIEVEAAFDAISSFGFDNMRVTPGWVGGYCIVARADKAGW